ncbi:hypothetical protein QQY66_28725 [Streptomyces sp. DG2A-72]|uniref:hypothetical protein n=1 Tax=Streptomyces sp. DG2A-72 TaxID=3051386 RepID=UPI00265BECB4|nr:hypothetical protein [Streptomyces sp. DG2A-72]MDO0935459.1 hypothetical protein [Streptomyces sp. DG2A-72]
MKHRTWIAAAIGTAAVTLAVGLWIDTLGTGHTDGGLRADPRTSVSAPAEDMCVGTLPSPTGSGDPARDTPLFRTLARIDELGADAYSDVYTGLSVDQDDNAADVWPIPPPTPCV